MKKYEKRLEFAFFGIIFLFLFIILRLFWLQIWRYDFYKEQAIKNSTLNIKKNALRGKIKDRNGITLAKSIQKFILSFYGTKKEIEYIKETLAFLGFKKFKMIQKNLTYQGLYWDEVSKILQQEIPIPEIEIEQERLYGLEEAASHIIGYVAKEGPQGRYIGKTGLEKMMESSLAGEDGEDVFVIDSRRKRLNKRSQKKPKKAIPVRVSLDADIQIASYEALSGHIKGAMIIVDLEHGEILSAASFPGFEPQIIIQGNKEEIKKYYEDPQKPLFNLFLNGTFPPGSVIKPLSFLAALDQGIAKAYECNGEFYLGNTRFKCWRKHGNISLARIIPESCDISFYSWSLKMMPETLEKIWNMFGIGQPVLGEIGGKPGFFPTRDWIRKKYKRSWRSSDSLLMQIGQGETAITLAEMVRAFARIATGRKIELNLLPQHKKTEISPKLEIPEEHLNLLRKGLFETINTPGGTAYWVYQRKTHNLMAGKTGTSQVRKMKEDEYGKGNKNRKWEERDHALFCAFGPHDKPKIGGCAIIIHGGSGGLVAAPVLLGVMEKALIKISGPPSERN